MFDAQHLTVMEIILLFPIIILLFQDFYQIKK